MYTCIHQAYDSILFSTLSLLPSLLSPPRWVTTSVYYRVSRTHRTSKGLRTRPPCGRHASPPSIIVYRTSTWSRGSGCTWSPYLGMGPSQGNRGGSNGLIRNSGTVKHIRIDNKVRVHVHMYIDTSLLMQYIHVSVTRDIHYTTCTIYTILCYTMYYITCTCAVLKPLLYHSVL